MHPRISVVEPLRMSQARSNASDLVAAVPRAANDGDMNHKSIEERIAAMDIATLSALAQNSQIANRPIAGPSPR